MTTILFAAKRADWAAYEAPLRQSMADLGVSADLVLEADPAEVDYLIYSPASTVQDFRPYTRLKAVLSLWAGVESIVGNTTLQVPLCRMVDPGLTEGMVEWVTGHVLRHHLGMDAHIQGQDGVWRNDVVPPLARDRRVAVLGLGALGSACAQMLAQLQFNTLGWSRRPKDISGVSCYSGEDGLRQVLSQAEIVVLLLPATPQTENTLNAESLALLPRGAVIINPGRGTLIDDEALLSALDTGQVGHATLDVFRAEPLPPEHAYWQHPCVTVTPHIASETRPVSAARTVMENIHRHLNGAALLNVVDRATGY
ncbi:glyoxylate/hydroxypyruvate reductase A [Rubricella aquisinus]|uniref:Glyoxylate/hydroxypyruvate reductase A n=1 Tax=Rubricella aquisinus TaxID=2028108 RepID=A0A840X4G4_9RHOB|nr:glyoxylate/hydroxypyruvate reductase A [Rubricella aquisinus]MBB5516725.1 glyoxylate/hydroxypyruvate reductase A [Rubricella aquisinus]